jgi:hypothetical protein
MGELGADAAEIVPHAGENGFDLFGLFFRESSGQIGAPNPLLAHHGADHSGDAAKRVSRLDRAEIAGGAQHADGEPADRGLAERPCGGAHARPGSGKQWMHRDDAGAG